MDIRMSKERLSHQIRQYAERGFEARQVSRRLLQLLPTRLRRLKMGLSKGLRRRSAGERHALISEDYLNHIQELTDIRYQAMSSKIQYETHIMLFQARQSLAKLRRPGP